MSQAAFRSARRSLESGQHRGLSSAFVDPPRTLGVRARDGVTLGARIYEPEGPIYGNVLIHGATAVPQRFYAPFARDLANAGLRVITYDYRGIGASRPAQLRGYSASMADWARLDARALHRYVRDHYAGQHLAIVGHSFGAQLIGLVDETRHADAAVFVGGQLGYCGYWPHPQSLGLRLLWTMVVPTLSALFGYMPGAAGLGEDLPRGVAEQWARWCSDPRYLVSDFPEANARFARFDVPSLAYSFTDDSYAPQRAVDALLRRLTGAPVEHRRLSPQDLALRAVGHFGFFRPAAGARLWREVREFLLERSQSTAAPADINPSQRAAAVETS